MIISAAAAIEINKQALNELNVFPVPDGDTGTNMSMTINSAASDLRKTEDPDLEKASKVAASAMLRGARGNSGVILSLLFRGISKRLKGSEECDGVLWAQALQEGVDAAYKAVMKPAEGTILTVARLSAAKAADAARENNFIEFVHEAAIEEAVKALADTVNQNPVLKKAGVVDAGGKGWVVALEAMLSALQGEDVVLPEDGGVTETKQSADFSDFNTEDITFSYAPMLDDPAALPQAANRVAGLSRLWLHAPFAELIPCAIDPLVRQTAQHRFRQTLAAAQKLGIRQVVLHGGFIPHVYFPEWYVEQSVLFWRDFLQEVPPDFVLALENVMEPSPDTLVSIAAGVDDPRLGLCLDVGHANTCVSRTPPLDWIAPMAPYLRHVHLHNNRRQEDLHAPLDEGTVPMQEIIGAVLEQVPRATFTIENQDALPSLRWLAQQGYIEDIL